MKPITAEANQVPPLEPYNLYTSDPVLADAMDAEGAKDDRERLVAFGKRVGSQEVGTWGHQANRHEPELLTHDRNGDRIDEVSYHPAYHSLLDLSVAEGLHCLHFERQPGEGGYVTRNTMLHLMSQVEVGHGCPISMTGSVLLALRHLPELAEVWEPKIVSRHYDPGSPSLKTRPGACSAWA